MIDYDNLPVIEMKRAWFMDLEDRSNFLGLDREPGHRFRCNLNVFCPFVSTPCWIVGTFYVDEEAKAKTLRNREGHAEHSWGGITPEDLYPDRDFIKTRWERVVFTDGPAPEHTIEEMLGLVCRYEVTKARLGL